MVRYTDDNSANDFPPERPPDPWTTPEHESFLSKVLSSALADIFKTIIIAMTLALWASDQAHFVVHWIGSHVQSILRRE